jgi:hypothetical protein
MEGRILGISVVVSFSLIGSSEGQRALEEDEETQNPAGNQAERGAAKYVKTAQTTDGTVKRR